MISLRARGSRSRIKYRLVDEYQTEFCLPEHTSREPFSLRELISFLDSAEHYGGDPEWHRFGFVLSFNECNLDCAQDADLETLDDLHDFTSISSDFYPGLSAHYGQVIEEWYSVREREIQEERNNPEPMLRRTLARVEKHWGPEHVSIVPHLIALAQRLKDTNQFAEVELLFRRVRAIEEKHYGRKVSALPPDWNDGACNPVNPNSLKTDCLWKRILSREGLTDILENCAQVVETPGTRRPATRRRCRSGRASTSSTWRGSAAPDSATCTTNRSLSGALLRLRTAGRAFGSGRVDCRNGLSVEPACHSGLIDLLVELCYFPQRLVNLGSDRVMIERTSLPTRRRERVCGIFP